VSPDAAWEVVLPHPDGEPPPYVYVRERFKIAAGVLDALPFAKPLDDYQAAIRASFPDWERVFVCGSVTGDPFRFVQLWRVPSPLAYVEAWITLERRGGEGYRRFLAGLVELDRDLLSPMPYDPALRGQLVPHEPAPPEAVVLIDEVKVKRGALARLSCLKERFFVPRVTGAPSPWIEPSAATRGLGFRLLVSATLLTGRPGALVQCWQLRDAGALLRAMRVLAENETYRAHLGPCVESEEQGLYELLLTD
jgi:hypothetical protein